MHARDDEMATPRRGWRPLPENDEGGSEQGPVEGGGEAAMAAAGDAHVPSREAPHERKDGPARRVDARVRLGLEIGTLSPAGSP